MSSDGVQIAQAVTTIAAAKAIGNGSAVSLPTRVVTAVFPTAFYLEEDNRASGIRVQFESVLTAGQAVSVMGKMGIADNGERAILSPLVSNPITTSTVIQPLSMITQAVGGKTQGLTPGVTDGAGLNNIGLLIKIAGRVSAVTSDGFYLDDGSLANTGAAMKDETGNTGIKVWTGVANSAIQNSYVTLTGIISLSKTGVVLYPQVLMRSIAP